jgi:hypothetical protein
VIAPQPHVGVDDRQTAAGSGHVFHQLEHRGGVQVVEDPEAKDHVELTVFGDRKVADVVLFDPHALQAQGAGGKTRFFDAGPPPFDAHHLGPVHSQLDPVEPLQTGQIQDPQLGQRLPRTIRHDL